MGSNLNNSVALSPYQFYITINNNLLLTGKGRLVNGQNIYIKKLISKIHYSVKCNLKEGGKKMTIFCTKPHSDPSTEDEEGVLKQEKENLPFLFLLKLEAEIMQMEDIFSILLVVSFTEHLLKYLMLHFIEDCMLTFSRI